MLKNTKDLYGNRLDALDGDIGQVKDFYFDDKTWVVRYMVADTGSWLTGRLVLLSPHSFGRYDQDEKVFQIKLTRARIESSPSIESHRPVSRQYEIDYYRYYGWPTYWSGSGMWGLGSFPVVAAPSKAELLEQSQFHHRDDKHLQSAHAVTGYDIQSVDGPIGHVSGLMVDDRSWAVPELVVDTGHWYSGKEILIPTKRVVRISYEDSKVFVSLSKADIERTGANEMASAGSGAHGEAGHRD
jgi:uncharacterized protein YrrD